MIRFNFSKLPDLKPSVRTTSDDMRALGLSATRRLVKSTVAGESPNGGVFEKYSPKYQLFRVSKGRGEKPNLSFTGRMLRSVKPTGITDSAVDLRFLGVDERTLAIFHHFGFSGSVTKRSKKGKLFTARINLPARPFFALSSEHEAALVKLLQTRFAKRNKTGV